MGTESETSTSSSGVQQKTSDSTNTGGDNAAQVEELRAQLAAAQELAEKYRREAQSQGDQFHNLERRLDEITNAASKVAEPDPETLIRQNWNEDPALLSMAKNQNIIAQRMQGLERQLERTTVGSLNRIFGEFLAKHPDFNPAQNPEQSRAFIEDLNDRLPEGAKYDDIYNALQRGGRLTPQIVDVIDSLDVKLSRAYATAFKQAKAGDNETADAQRVEARSDTLSGKTDSSAASGGAGMGYKEALTAARGR